jgi:hypothetical protein
MSYTLRELVRKQILDELPHLSASLTPERAITSELNILTPEELLQRISAALDQILRELPTRLGI